MVMVMVMVMGMVMDTFIDMDVVTGTIVAAGTVMIIDIVN